VKITPARAPEPETAGGLPQGVRILAFLCGLLVCWLGFKSARQDWKRIESLTHLDRLVPAAGKILHAQVRVDSAGSGEDWYPDVLYEFFIDGKSVWGWRLSYEEEPGTKAYWEDRLKGYAAGNPVGVFYDPAAPKDAILEKKHDSLFRVWMKLGLGAGFLIVGLILAGLSLSGWIRR
jgi:hypothetical protein